MTTTITMNIYFGSYTYQIDMNFDYITINTSKLLYDAILTMLIL